MASLNLCKWSVSALMVCTITSANAAGVFRCPDGSYQDKRCGEGEKLVTTTQRIPDKPVSGSCSDVGVVAERSARAKMNGIALEFTQNEIDKQQLPIDIAAKQKRAVALAYRMEGSPTDVRARVVADCVREQTAGLDSDAAANRAIAAKANPMPAEPAANSSVVSLESGERKRTASIAVSMRCDGYRAELETTRFKQRRGGSIGEMEMLNLDQRRLEKAIAANCT